MMLKRFKVLLGDCRTILATCDLCSCYSRSLSLSKTSSYLSTSFINNNLSLRKGKITSSPILKFLNNKQHAIPQKTYKQQLQQHEQLGFHLLSNICNYNNNNCYENKYRRDK